MTIYNGLFIPFMLFIVLQSVAADAGSSNSDQRVLNNRLNALESRAVQRQGRKATIVDLLDRQDRRLAGQALNRLKTIDPRKRDIPLLEGKLRRSQRPIGSPLRR